MVVAPIGIYGANMASLRELRAQAAKRTKAASDKMSRLRKQGVEVRGSEFDVRLPKSRVDKMNRNQLAAYMRRINAFTDRNAKFDAGANGAPLPRHLVKQYQAAERVRNLRLGEHMQQYDSLEIEGTGMTIGQRRELMEQKQANVLRAGGPGFSPYLAHTREVSGFASAEALRTLIKHERRTYQNARINLALQEQKDNHINWLLEHGEAELAATVDSMSLRQFDVLKHHTNYTQDIKFMYFGTGEVEDESVASRLRDDNLSNARDLASWAGKLEL